VPRADPTQRRAAPGNIHSVSGRILACGGGGAFDSFLLGLAASRRPKVSFLPTAVADEQAAVVGFYERFVPLACEP